MLKIYKASAGSGKTYNLALEYLRLLFSSSEKEAYRRILAVTFTNKATGEMKQRIVQELFVLSHDVRRSKYFDDLTAKLRLNASDLQRRAQEILFSLLHDFSSFNVDTIDRFFQQTTRAFTREIGLQGGYNLEIDNTHVLSEAIDRMLFGLEDVSSRELLDWLLKFSEEKVENAESWDIRKNIKTLSDEIFKESYRQSSRELLKLTADKAFMDAYKKDLRQIQRDFEHDLQELGRKGEQLIARFGLQMSDFKNGDTSFSHFSKWASGEVKLPTATFRGLAGNLSEWYTKKASSKLVEDIKAVYEGGLNCCVEEAVDLFSRRYPRYLAAVETSRDFYTLGILSDIDRNVKAYEQEHNLLLLSDTTELLHRIIDGSDTPFVYEKIGSRIDHLMIDEFQDTSSMQWDNFRPLFEESLDRGHRSFIVGDVKQSIYRWRNSDWNLLHSGLQRSFDAQQLQHVRLNTNWRSASLIIDFNNALFQRAAKVLQEQMNTSLARSAGVSVENGFDRKITDVYADINQHVAPGRCPESGHIRLLFKEDSDSWKEEVLDDLPDILRQLQDRGVQLRDIAFLVRTNEDGRMIADKLLACKKENTDPRYRFDVISDEALCLGNAPVVRLIISILRYLQNPGSAIARAQAVYEYAAFQRKENPSEALRCCFSGPEEDVLSGPMGIDAVFDALRSRSLFEMCEKIIEYFPSSDKSSQVYIQAFQDMVLSYTSRYSSDLTSFLQWWDERGKNKTISTPASQNAIRIMTIHQSKGLEFKTVIIPFCDWKLDVDTRFKSHILWCRPGEPPFDWLPLVPVRYKETLAQSIYATDYFHEKIHSYIDNLNLAYVAFTRAEEELILIMPKSKNPEKKKISTISSLIYHCVTSPDTEIETAAGEKGRDLIDLSLHYDKESLTFELGQAPAPAAEAVPEPDRERNMPDYRSVDFKDRLQLRLYGKGFFGDREIRRYGILMHEILSTIRSAEDLSAAVRPYVLSGQLTSGEADEAVSHIRTWISAPEVSRWFAPDVQVLNEIEILRPDGLFYRPDRVVLSDGEVTVIDYKFGKVERESYCRQVERYVSLIREMGYASVTGYIWYVELSKIVKV
ncbi:MAG: UvrD-helicase domain-containing protein [Coprobacter sp.]|nr:UvrD-helicase domain-containing protein [Coprobacter sp.]